MMILQEISNTHFQAKVFMNFYSVTFFFFLNIINVCLKYYYYHPFIVKKAMFNIQYRSKV